MELLSFFLYWLGVNSNFRRSRVPRELRSWKKNLKGIRKGQLDDYYFDNINDDYENGIDFENSLNRFRLEHFFMVEDRLVKACERFSNIGLGEYIVYQDKKLFKKNSIKAMSSLGQQFVGRYKHLDDFDNVNDYALNHLSFCLFNIDRIMIALSSGAIAASTEVLSLMGVNRGLEEYVFTERFYQRPRLFMYLGYALKGILTEELDLAHEFLPKYISYCREHDDYKVFLSYGLLLDAILKKDLEHARKAIEIIIEENVKITVEENKFFCFRPVYRRFFCIWGIALVNVARSSGLALKADNKLIPNRLLVPVKKQLGDSFLGKFHKLVKSING